MGGAQQRKGLSACEVGREGEEREGHWAACMSWSSFFNQGRAKGCMGEGCQGYVQGAHLLIPLGFTSLGSLALSCFSAGPPALRGTPKMSLTSAMTPPAAGK